MPVYRSHGNRKAIHARFFDEFYRQIWIGIDRIPFLYRNFILGSDNSPQLGLDRDIPFMCPFGDLSCQFDIFFKGQERTVEHNRRESFSYTFIYRFDTRGMIEVDRYRHGAPLYQGPGRINEPVYTNPFEYTRAGLKNERGLFFLGRRDVYGYNLKAAGIQSHDYVAFLFCM